MKYIKFTAKELKELNSRVKCKEMPYDTLFMGCEMADRVMFSASVIGSPVQIKHIKKEKG